MRVGRSILCLVFWTSPACSTPNRSDAGIVDRVDTRAGDAPIDPRIDAPGTSDGGASDAGATDAGSLSDAPSLDGGAVLTTCTLADGHACTRWARTEPSGVWACLGYDGLGATCTNDPPTTRCDLLDGHDCTRWIETEPDGVWACLGYDDLGAVCE